jgi:hypothetical protein
MGSSNSYSSCDDASSHPGLGKKMKRAWLIGCCLLLISGCRAILGSCTYEERSVVAHGSASNGGVEIVSADITVSAIRGSLRWKAVDAVIRGESLRGHVTSIVLVGTRDGSLISLPIPLDSPSSPLLSTGGLFQREGEDVPDLGGVYELVASNDASIEMTTDLPQVSRLVIPLAVSDKTDWFRPDNCY